MHCYFLLNIKHGASQLYSGARQIQLGYEALQGGSLGASLGPRGRGLSRGPQTLYHRHWPYDPKIWNVHVIPKPHRSSAPGLRVALPYPGFPVPTLTPNSLYATGSNTCTYVYVFIKQGQTSLHLFNKFVYIIEQKYFFHNLFLTEITYPTTVFFSYLPVLF